MSAIDFTRPVTTRQGVPVEIVTTAGRQRPILGYVADDKKLTSWSGDGRWDWNGIESHYGRWDWNGIESHFDLIQAPAWKLPDPPTGRKWHREDFTEEMLPYGWRPLLLDEVPDRGQGDEGFFNVGGWDACGSSGGAHPNMVPLRTRRPLPLERKTVPLGPEDVPPGSALRRKGGRGEWTLPIACTAEGVAAVARWRGQAGWQSWNNLFADYEILRPGETEWKPCHKEATP